MQIVYTNKSFDEKGIHIYDQSLIKKIMIPYTNNKLNITKTIYVHNIETDKQWEVIETPENKQIMDKILAKVFSIKYIEKPKTRWIKPVEPEPKPEVVETYDFSEDDWKKPKKKGNVDEWI